MRLSVTGITSGVGRRLAEIAIEQGHTLTGLVRNLERADARALAALGVQLIQGDLEAAEPLERLCRGADAVLHLAARVGDRGTLEQFDRVNVGGTRNTIDAAVAAGVGMFVYLSSASVYGRPDRGRVTEEWPTRKSGLPYEDTKTEAERLAFARGRTLGVPVIAIRPPIIYGPHDRNFMPRMVDMLRRRRFLLIDGGRAPLNAAWVDHVASALLLAAARPDLAGEAFNVMDEVSARPPEVREVAEAIARELLLPPPRLSLPFPVAMGMASIVELVHAIRKAEGAPVLSRFVVKIMSRDVIYDAGKAVRLLGFTPQVHTIEGIARAAQAYKAGRPEGGEAHGQIR